VTDSVTLIHLDIISKDELSEIEVALGNLGITPRVSSSTPGIQAAAEWALPALITILIVQPFFGEFFKELGKAAGQGVTNAMANAITRLKGRPPAWRTAHDLRSPEKPYKERHSPVLRISLTIEEGLRIDFVFPATASSAEPHQLEGAILAIPEVISYEMELQARYEWLRRRYVVYGYDNFEGKWKHDEFFTYNVARMKKAGLIPEDKDL